jgi:hypothetical protein
MARPAKRPGMVLIFTPYITRKGKRIYASQYGKTVFAFWVPKDKLKHAS